MGLPIKSPTSSLLAWACLAIAITNAAADEPAFPIRLLPAQDVGAPSALLDVSFESGSVAGWRLLDPSDTAGWLEGEAPRPEVRDGTVVLRPGVAWVRFLALPAEHRARVEALLDHRGRFVAGGYAPELRLLPLTPSDPSVGVEALDVDTEVVDLRALQLGTNGTERLADQLVRRLRSEESRSRWLPGTDEGPLAVARGHVDWRPSPTLAALVIFADEVGGADEAPLGVRMVRVDVEAVRWVLPEQLVEARHEASQVRRVDARLGGDRRAAFTLAPGESAELSSSRPTRGATSLSFGVARPPTSAAGRLRFLVALRDDDAETVIDEGDVDPPPTRFASFVDREVEWPAGVDARRVVFTNRGDIDLIVGHPVIHGSPGVRGPNVLFISIDTLRADHLGCYGYERPTSPFLDALAGRSARFRDCVAAAPFTLPTHATMLTGLHPPRHGATDINRRLDAGAVSYLPRALADAGYVTAAFVGGGYVSEDFGFHVGFDRFVASDPMRPRDGVGVVAHGIEGNRVDIEDVGDWVEDRRDEPWFVFLHTYAVHDYFAPRELFERFDRGASSRWRVPFPRLPVAGEEPAPTEEDVRYLVDLYDATIRHVDGELERLFQRLDSLGELADTVVVVTSDHGEEFLDHGDLGHSVSLYEEQVRVPLIVGGPGVDPGVVPESIHQVDLAPTLRDLVGLPADEGLDGASRVAWLRGEYDVGTPSVLFSQVETDQSRRTSLRVGRWKIVLGEVSDAVEFPSRSAIELYDLREDPQERHNLADVEQGRAARLAKELRGLMRDLRKGAAGRDADLSREVLEHLRQIGYLPSDGR